MLHIIKPKAEIIESTGSVVKDVERVGRVCYKTEDKITDNSAESFVQRIINRKHLSVLEFGMIRATVPSWPVMHIRNEMAVCPYLEVREYCDGKMSVTGSVRAFREFLETAISHYFGLRKALTDTFPSLFSYDGNLIPGDTWSFEIPTDTHTLVKFTVNRNMTHELVRHRVFSFMQESQRYCRYDEELTVIEPLWFTRVHDAYKLAWKNQMLSSHERYKFMRQELSPQESREVLPTATKAELYMLGSNKKWQAFFDLRCSSGADPEMRRIAVPLREEFKLTGRI